MTAQPEARLVAIIQANLKRRGWLVHKLHGSPMQAAGWPDLLAWKAGTAAAVEVKLPGGKPTKLQAHVLGLLQGQQVRCGVATSVEEAVAICEGKKNFETGVDLPSGKD